MAEWLKAHAWKACIPQGIQGSNPCLSATDLHLGLPGCEGRRAVLAELDLERIR